MVEYILIAALVVSFVLHALLMRWCLKLWGFQTASATDLLTLQNIHAFAIVELFLRAHKHEKAGEYIKSYYDVLSKGLPDEKKAEADRAMGRLTEIIGAGPPSTSSGVDRLRQRLATLKNEGGPPLEQS